MLNNFLKLLIKSLSLQFSSMNFEMSLILFCKTEFFSLIFLMLLFTLFLNVINSLFASVNVFI